MTITVHYLFFRGFLSMIVHSDHGCLKEYIMGKTQTNKKLLLAVTAVILLLLTASVAFAEKTGSRDPNWATKEEAVAGIVAQMKNAIGSDASDYEKAFWLHDWLTDNAYYDYGDGQQEPEGVLIRGWGVCDSYSKAYKLLLDNKDIDIENYRVTGTVINSGGNPEDHAWNLVQLDGKWCHIDVTWDDPVSIDPSKQTIPYSEEETHMYFGMNTALITRDHTIDGIEGTRSIDIDTVTSLDNYYPLKPVSGIKTFLTEEEMASYLHTAASAKSTEPMDFCYIGTDKNFNTLDVFNNWLNTYESNYGIIGYKSNGGPFMGTYTFTNYIDAGTAEVLILSNNTYTTYYTLSEAISRAEDGNKITVLKDINNSATSVNAGNKNITIDLNGHNVNYGTITTTGGLSITDNLPTVGTLNAVINNNTNGNAVLAVTGNASVNFTGTQWLGNNIIVSDKAALTFKNSIKLGGVGFSLTIDGNDAKVVLDNVVISANDSARVQAQLQQYAAGSTVTVNGTTRNTLTLRNNTARIVTHTVTFKVVNGSWNDGTTANKTVTLTGREGEDLKLKANQIPTVGNRPGTGYVSGAWNNTPDTNTAITADVTYTYTYAEEAAPVVTHTVTFKVVNGSWNDGTTANKTVRLTGREGEELKLKANQIPAVGNRPGAGYAAGVWNSTPDTNTAITADVTYTYTYAAVPAGTYTVTITSSNNGTVVANPSSAAPGTVVTLTAIPNAGYQFKEWRVISGNVRIVNNQFTIGTENVEIIAVFEATRQAPDTPDFFRFDFDVELPRTGITTPGGFPMAGKPASVKYQDLSMKLSIPDVIAESSIVMVEPDASSRMAGNAERTSRRKRIARTGTFHYRGA